MSKLLYFQASQLEIIEKGDILYIKSFLVDSSINSNNWAVTEDALKKNISTFIGKPIVLTEKFDHPDAGNDGDELLRIQEDFRIGTILAIGIEELSGKGWVIAEITDRNAIDIISQTGINFVSPSIVFNEEDIDHDNGIEIVTNFEGAHLAIVKDPAYGMQKAQIKGQCRGGIECISQLQKVQASVEKSKCGNYLIVKQGSTQNILKSSECVEKWIKELQDTHPEWEIEQVIAVALSKCGESRESECKVDQLGNCVIDSSLSEIDTKNELMTAQEDEKEEEEKARKAQEDEKEKEEKARKAQEEEEKKKEEEAKHAQDEDRDKDEVAKLRAELHDLKEKVNDSARIAKAKPIVDKIVTAKVKLNLIKESESQKEFDSLIGLSEPELNTLASQYAQVSTAERPYSVLTLGASTESTSGDDLLIKLGSVD